MTASMALDGPMKSAWFISYVEQVQASTLTAGDVVIFDNLPAHDGAAVRKAVGANTVPAALLPRLQADRRRLFQAEGAAP